VLLTPEQAAERIVRIATSPASGTVTGQCFAGSDRTILLPLGARNSDARRRLWDVSTRLTQAPELSAAAHGDR
jgi:hypothetical protein